MFNGYRIKIGGVVFNDSFIAKGTYSCVRKKRVVETWVDANQVEHPVFAPSDKTVITFDLREHNSSEHTKICQLLQGYNNITVEYYDDRSDSYKSGTFRCSDLQFSHKNLTQTSIDYNSTKVTLTEN